MMRRALFSAVLSPVLVVLAWTGNEAGRRAKALLEPLPPPPATVAVPQTESVGTPKRLIIEKLGIDAPIETVGLVRGGAMEPPRNTAEVGWYGNGPRPGEDGDAVIAGHLDSKTAPAVFWHLKKLEQGDIVSVVDDNDISRQFRVTGKRFFTSLTGPVPLVFGGSADAPHLNLITCSGTWDKNLQEYGQRLVVFLEGTD